jgi:hypothetical protein
VAAHLDKVNNVILDNLSIDGELTMEEFVDGSFMDDDVYVEGCGQFLALMWCFFKDIPQTLRILISLLLHESLGFDYIRISRTPLDTLDEHYFGRVIWTDEDLEAFAHQEHPTIFVRGVPTEALSYVRFVAFWNPDKLTPCFRLQWLDHDHWTRDLPESYPILRVNTIPCFHVRTEPMYCDFYLEPLPPVELYVYEMRQVVALLETPYTSLRDDDEVLRALMLMGDFHADKMPPSES